MHHGISYQWIAQKLGYSSQKVQYQLNVAKDIGFHDYVEYMRIFETNGFIKKSEERTSSLASTCFEVNSVIGMDLKQLNDTVMNDLADNKFSPDERIKLRVRLEDMKKQFGEVFEKLIKVTFAE